MAKNTVRDLQRKLRCQAAVARILAVSDSLATAAPALLEVIGSAFEWQAGLVWAPTDNRAHLVCRGTWPSATRYRPYLASCLGCELAIDHLPAVDGRAATILARDVPLAASGPYSDGALSAGLPVEVVVPAGESGALFTFLAEGRPEADEESLAALAGITAQLASFDARCRAERPIQGPESRARAVVAADLDAIILMDVAGAIVELNAAAERLFGYPSELAVGKRVAELLIPPRLRAEHEAGLQRFHETGTGAAIGRIFETTALRVTGKEFQVELAVMPITVDGQQLFAGYARDISAVRQQEEWVSRANDFQSELLSLVAHEVRSPIASMVANLEVLARTGALKDEEAIAILGDLRDSGGRLSRVVANMLALGRVAPGKPVATEPVLVHHLVSEVVGRCRASRPDREFLVQMGPGLPPVLGEPTFIDQVLENLISNADKYGPPGKPVHVHVRQAGNWVEIEVQDEGGGLSREEVHDFFAPFFRSDRTSGTAPGIGLGLTVCKRLVEAQQGRIWADSPEGGGTAFGFALPVVELGEE